MVQLLSIPMLIAGSFSFLFFLLYLLLYIRTGDKDKQHRSYIFFSLLSLTNCVFSIGFGILISVSQYPHLINIFNRIAIIGASWNIIFALHFSKVYFGTTFKRDLYPLYFLSGLVTVLCFFDTPLFLTSSVYKSTYYTGLFHGTGFRIWGASLILIAIYTCAVMIYGYIKNRHIPNYRTSMFFIIASVIWCITAICDAISAMQIHILPPLTWIGSILVVVSIAVILILKMDHLYHEIIHDSLTGIHSRSFFEVEFENAYNRLKRHKANLYVILVDIDAFKSVNDTYGHQCGDEVIKMVASSLANNLREHDIVARYGGDEFIILLNENISDTTVTEVFNRIRSKIESSSIECNNNIINVSCSFGITMFEQATIQKQITRESIIAAADDALYKSKDLGKNRVSFS